MKTTIDKAGRVVIPAAIRTKLGFHPGVELQVVQDDVSVRLIRKGPGAKLVRKGKRWVARSTAPLKDRPAVDVPTLVEEERDRWPW